MCFTRQSSFVLLATLLLGLAAVTPAAAQSTTPVCVSLSATGTAYTQDFDTLVNTAGSTTNNLSIAGWFMTESGSGARDNEQYAVDTGTSTTGDTYSYGVAGSTDRALGSLRSGTLISNFGACFTNNTGSAITSVVVAYTGEQWRLGTAARTDQLSFEYSVNATDLVAGTWSPVAALNFVTPDTATTGAKNGNAAAARSALSATIPALGIANGATFWVRWLDTDASGADDGLAVDDFSLTPSGGAVQTSLMVNDVSLNESNSGTSSFSFTVSLSAPAGPGGVVFDIATADGTAMAPGDYTARSLTGQTIPAGSSSYTFDVLVNGDTEPEPNETFFVNVSNVTGAAVADGQGLGTIVNDEMLKIHAVQGSGAASPVVGNTVSVEGVVVGRFQGTSQLSGFFLQEEDADADTNPATSEGIFIFCSGCPTPVAEGQRVRVTGQVSEFFDMTQISATTAGAVLVTDSGNRLSEVTPATINLPIAGDINAFYEAREGMIVRFSNTLTVAEYFELARFGQIVLFEGGRPFQFTETNAPSAAGYAAYLDGIARRRVILDDDSNAQNGYLMQPEGNQVLFYPRANGGFSAGTQGTDFFRGGDLVNGLTGVLHWSFPGSGDNTWRIRPSAGFPVTFTAANPRPATPPSVGGAIKAASINLLNYFTTIDTTSSDASGACGPSSTLDCRGADGVAELDRQRERASIVICSLNADVYGLVELENTTASATITDLLGAVNARCGGTRPYQFVNTGGTLGTDAIRVQLIYRSGVLAPVGVALSDLDPIHNRPPTAQTFNVVDAANPAAGERFTVIASHFKSKGCSGASGANNDAADGQACFAAQRTQQATRLLAWVNATVLPAAGDPDVLLLGDFNSYARETPVTTLTGAGFVDLEATLGGPNPYSYLFDAGLGRLDYAFASASLAAKVTQARAWHINADEVPVLDYNDAIRDTGEAPFEEKPDGSALVPPRIVFQPGTPFRASDHDPVLVGLFPTADLAISKSGSPNPVLAGANLSYTIVVTNNGPDAAASTTWSDPLPAGTAFASLSSPTGWVCTPPAVGAGGTVSCTKTSMALGSASFTLMVVVGSGVSAGAQLVNTASVSATTRDPVPANGSATATTTVVGRTVSGNTATGSGSASANLSGGGASCVFTSTAFVPAPAAPPAGVSFPQGFFQFTATPCTAGGSISVTVTYPNPIPPGAQYYKFGPELGNPTPHYYTIPATISGNSVTFSVTDGDVGDSDGVVNGSITDPGGIGLVALTGVQGIPTLGEWALLMLASLMLLAGVQRVRRRA